MVAGSKQGRTLLFVSGVFEKCIEKMNTRIKAIRFSVALIAITALSCAASPSVETGGTAQAIHCPYPNYPYEARTRHMAGSGLFLLRIEIKSGRVKRVTIVKSTGHSMLDSEAVTALKYWRFQPGKLRPIRELLPGVNDAFRDQDSLAKVPVTFTMNRR